MSAGDAGLTETGLRSLAGPQTRYEPATIPAPWGSAWAPAISGAARRHQTHSLAQRALKRCLDIVLSALGLLLASPLWALAALAILLDDGRPVLYRQPRWGQHGTTFQALKLRTMVRDADRAGVRQATEADPRVTRTGRLLRACGLDELPQLVNILRGQMSLVGPRALAVGELVDQLADPATGYEELPGFRERHAVRPGLTGPAVVHLPKDVHPLAKFAADVRYAQSWSLRLDLRLIAQSVWISLRGRWESRDAKL